MDNDPLPLTSDEDLDLVETERLIQALRRRFKATLIVYVEEIDAEAEGTRTWFSGGMTMAMGLVSQARRYLNWYSNQHKQHRPHDDE